VLAWSLLSLVHSEVAPSLELQTWTPVLHRTLTRTADSVQVLVEDMFLPLMKYATVITMVSRPQPGRSRRCNVPLRVPRVNQPKL